MMLAAFAPIEPQLRRENGKLYIFDLLRKKYLLLTPEEWVRQHLIHHLLNLNYPKGRMASEQGLRYNSLSRRADLLIYDDQGKPFLLAECKAPTVALSVDTWAQIAAYQKSLQAQFLIITNGLELRCFQFLPSENDWKQLAQIPPYAEV
jgi:type I site-specific restriction endonuclease